jgi:NHL repeat
MTPKAQKLVPLFLLCTLAILAFAATPALAAEKYGFTSSFVSEQGAHNGEFKEPDGVAVNDATEDVYVVDNGNNRVEYFSSTGTYIGQFNGTEIDGAPASKVAPAKFSEPEAIAVDNDASSPSHGDVYVVDSSQGVIDKFSATGEYLGQLTKTEICETAGELPPCEGSKLISAPFTAADLGDMAVDTEGHLWVANRHNMIFVEFGAGGSYERTVVDQYDRSVDSGEEGFGIDSEGYLYSCCQNKNIYKINPNPTENSPAGGEEAGPFFKVGQSPEVGESTDLAIAPGTNNLLADEGDRIAEFGPDGSSGQNPFTYFAPGYLTSSDGIAVNASGLIYATDSANNDVSIFTPGVGEPPLVTEEKSSMAGLPFATVKLEADVNPNYGKVEEECKFEYGTEVSLASTEAVSCTPPEFGGQEDGTNEPVSVTISGLKPGQTYYYRVAARNTRGQEGKGTIASFRIPDVPVLSIAAAQDVGQTAATLSGEVNPDSAETVYHFAYISEAGFQYALEHGAANPADPDYEVELAKGVPSPYSEGETTPALKLIEGGAPDTSDVSQALAETPISGLQPGETYHYALIAYNIAGTSVTPDKTFTTQVGTSPTVSTGGASGVSQNSATLYGTVTTNGLQTNYGFEIATEPGNYGPATGLGAIGGAATEEVHVTLGELQPGTTYYYRITATNADGTEKGLPESFTTPGFPTLLSTPTSPPLIATPNIAFPKEEPLPTGTTTKTLTNKEKLAKALKACKRDKSKSKRTTCEKAARKKYPAAKAKKQAKR